MKNKHKLVVSLAILLTLALLTFTGCVTTHTTYDLKNMGILTISDAIEDVLSSCIVVDVEYRKTGQISNHYSCIGLAVDKDTIIVPTQALPTEYGTTQYVGRVYGTNQVVTLSNPYKIYYEELGFRMLKLSQKDVELTPVKFGDSDQTALGEMLFGVQYDAPIAASTVSEVAADYMLTIPVLVAAKSMMVGNHNFFGLTAQMFEASFTTQGYFQDSTSNYSNFYSGEKGLAEERNLMFTNCWLFNNKGEFVGANYMSFVDSSADNKEVVAGIGYAYKSNNIKDLLLVIN